MSTRRSQGQADRRGSGKAVLSSGYRREIQTRSAHLHHTSAASTQPDIDHSPLQSFACSPCMATPCLRFLFIEARCSLHVSFPRSVTLTQLPFTVALHFAHGDQIAAGLAPAGVCPCRAHKKRGTEVPLFKGRSGPKAVHTGIRPWKPSWPGRWPAWRRQRNWPGPGWWPS